MSMLAEPRRRNRYNLTPKGKPLFDDNDRFGTKMLEKMGWSKGKGLGKDENGSQEFVRVKHKADVRGIGFEVRDDQWTEHDKKFNGLLENLNGGNDSSPDDFITITPTVGMGFAIKSGKKKLKDKISGQSLEENSKKSKARVHYKKFTKGKDMSQYSEKDLANIFGKKATPEDTNIYSQFQAFNAPGSDNDITENECVKEAPAITAQPIINTGISTTDYFKSKMDALKAKQGSTDSNPFNTNVRIINNVEMVVPSRKRKNSTDKEDSEKREALRKKKKTKSLEVEEFKSVIHAEDPETIEEQHIPRKKNKSKNQSIDVSAEEAPKKKKKSKKSKALNDANIDASKQQDLKLEVDDESNQNHNDSNAEELNSIKKKKKSKKVLVENIINEELVQDARVPEEPAILKKKKKKDKKRTSNANNLQQTESSSASVQEETISESTTQNTEDEENFKSTKSKKKNKQKNSTSTIEAEVSSHQKDLNLTNQNNYLLDTTYTISTFCAEKFRNIEIHKFPGSNLMDLNGYGLSTNLELDIKNSSNDAQRIMRLWSGTLDKYTHSTSKRKMYVSYMQKVKQARQKTPHKIPALKFKSLKRQHVFQCI